LQIIYQKDWISKEQVAETAEGYKKNSYGQYLLNILK